MLITIFLAKKLISCDSLLPILLTIKKKKNTKFVFFTIDKKTKSDIEKNIVLFECIKSLGSINSIELGDSIVCRLFLNHLNLMLVLCKCLKNLIFSNQLIFHYGFLDYKHTSFLYYLKKRNVYFFENNGWGYSNTIGKMNKLSGRKPVIRNSLNASKLVVFSKDYPYYLKYKKLNLKPYLLTHSKKWPAWDDYIQNEGIKIYEKECERLEINKDKKFILFILGTLHDKLELIDNQSKTIVKLFEESLDAIRKIFPESTIILKPHAITDLNILNPIIKNFNNALIKKSYTHPYLLSKFSKFAICNYYSNVMADIKQSGTKTIEYTNYTQWLLKLTKNNSFKKKYIDYFINNNINLLYTVLRKKSLLIKNADKKNNRLNKCDNEFLRDICIF